MTEQFNKHFGTDFTDREMNLCNYFAGQYIKETGIDQYETDDHWYAAIEQVLDLRVSK